MPGLSLQGTAFLWSGQVVVVVGPGGSGKTGVLLASLAAGATAVAAEEVAMDEDGRVRAVGGSIRIRARHLPLPPGVARSLRPLGRLRLRAGAALRWLPVVGSTIARRAFVDAELGRGAAVDPSPGGRIGALAVIVPTGRGAAPHVVPPEEGRRLLEAHVSGDLDLVAAVPVWRLDRAPEERDAAVAARLRAAITGSAGVGA